VVFDNDMAYEIPSIETIVMLDTTTLVWSVPTNKNSDDIPKLVYHTAATVLDSTMGNIVGQQMPEQLPTFTVALNITYKKPVTTPGTILARSWITKAEGRKIWISGTIESGTGEVHATAEGMWLRANAKI